MVTRSGSGPERAGISRVAADAADADVLARSSPEPMPSTTAPTRRTTAGPPTGPRSPRRCSSAATASGAVLVTMGNLYGYGPVDHPMTEDDPLTRPAPREECGPPCGPTPWPPSGRVGSGSPRPGHPTSSVPGVVETSFFGRNMAKLLAGRRISVLGDPDVPHSWTYVPDVGRTLAVLAHDERAWGRAWHVPSSPAVSQRELATEFCDLAGLPAPRVSAVPPLALAAAGLFSSQLRQLRETPYQFDRPFVLDSSATTGQFGLEATPRESALRTTLEAARSSVPIEA